MMKQHPTLTESSNVVDYTIYTDGGARGNPGPAAYGFVIYDNLNNIVYEEGKTIGNTTNNVAEYTAVIAALKYLSGRSAVSGQLSIVRVFLDSQLVAEQLSGRWKIKNETLRNLHFTIKELEKKIGAEIVYKHVRREKNLEADRLVNLALDNKL